MNWTKDKSIKLSLICVLIFAAIMLVLDVMAFKLVPWFVNSRPLETGSPALFYLTIYSGSVFGWICLWNMRKLLSNIQKEEIFIAGNVKCMRIISWCCCAACIICIASSIYYLPFFLLAVCCAFMMLIVRIVKNIFQQAIDMKSELDLTI